MMTKQKWWYSRMHGTAGMMVAAVAFLLHIGFVAGICDRYTGPSGTVQCVKLSGYTTIQWATCLTSTYIEEKSGNLHKCSGTPKATYCHYQCMLELHNKESGSVTSDCSCETAGMTLPPIVPLDPTCYSSTGDTCIWYDDCIEKKFTCSDGADGYAIEHAKSMCNRLNEFRHTLSLQQQQWMEATQKCLQVSLVPALRPFTSRVCAAVKQLAFASHQGCYLNTYSGIPSFCNLSNHEMLQVFWVIKGAFVPNFVESLLSLYQVLKQCAARNATSVMADGKTVLIKINMRMKDINSLTRSKRSAPAFSVDIKPSSVALNSRHRRQISSEGELLYHRLAGELSTAIASKLQWSEKGLLRFSYGQRGENSSVVEAYILLADKRNYGLQNLFEVGSAINMTSLLNSTAQAFQDGTLNGLTLQGQHLQLMTLSLCQDDNCWRAALTVVAPPDLSGSDVTRASFTALTALLLLPFHYTLL